MSTVRGPWWEWLFDIADVQRGYFTTKQAAEAGYSAQLLTYHVNAGKIGRVRRGIYRLMDYPERNNEDLIIARLWSEGQGVFSHQTALRLHGLCDHISFDIHMTLPPAWRRRRLQVPDRIVLYYADIPSDEVKGRAGFPVTTPQRTLNDCIKAGLALPHVVEALRRANDHDLLP